MSVVFHIQLDCIALHNINSTALYYIFMELKCFQIQEL